MSIFIQGVSPSLGVAPGLEDRSMLFSMKAVHGNNTVSLARRGGLLTTESCECYLQCTCTVCTHTYI